MDDDGESSLIDQYWARRAEAAKLRTQRRRHVTWLMQAIGVLALGLPMGIFGVLFCERLEFPRLFYGPAVALWAIALGYLAGTYAARRKFENHDSRS
jgi:hypothetical protein